MRIQREHRQLRKAASCFRSAGPPFCCPGSRRGSCSEAQCQQKALKSPEETGSLFLPEGGSKGCTTWEVPDRSSYQEREVGIKVKDGHSLVLFFPASWKATANRIPWLTDLHPLSRGSLLLLASLVLPGTEGVEQTSG